MRPLYSHLTCKVGISFIYRLPLLSVLDVSHLPTFDFLSKLKKRRNVATHCFSGIYLRQNINQGLISE